MAGDENDNCIDCSNIAVNLGLVSRTDNNTYLNVRVFSVPAELAIYILVGFYLGIQKTKISKLLEDL